MTIIAILLSFALCHFVRELGRIRDRRWLTGWVTFSGDAFGKLPGWPGVLGFVVILAVPLTVLLLLDSALRSVLGDGGAFLLAVLVLIYTFGPRDLDTDVAEILENKDEGECQESLQTLLGAPLPDNPDECRSMAVESVFQEALRRWFGIIFWFAVLGIIGAFLYRMTDWLVNEDHALSEGQKALFTRLLQIMDWPAAQMMTLSLAISTDFDSVFRAWKQYHDEQGHGLFEGDNGFLLAAARSVIMTGHATRDGYADQLEGPMLGLQQAMDLTWRMLGVWLTVLALLLLIDVIV